MNKKIVFTISALIIFIIIAVFTFQRTVSSNVEFVLADHVDQVRILSTENDEEFVVGTLSSSGNLTLRHGFYEIVASGNRVISSSIFIEVPEDTVVTVDPDYSRQYLEEILEAERSDIAHTIENELGEKLDGYTVAEGELLSRGNWYTSVIYENIVDTRQEPDAYRILLEKKDSKWQLVAGPKIVLTIYDYPELPLSILTSANEAVFRFSVEE